jgi:hypothetical protein
MPGAHLLEPRSTSSGEVHPDLRQKDSVFRAGKRGRLIDEPPALQGAQHSTEVRLFHLNVPRHLDLGHRVVGLGDEPRHRIQHAPLRKGQLRCSQSALHPTPPAYASKPSLEPLIPRAELMALPQRLPPHPVLTRLHVAGTRLQCSGQILDRADAPATRHERHGSRPSAMALARLRQWPPDLSGPVARSRTNMAPPTSSSMATPATTTSLPRQQALVATTTSPRCYDNMGCATTTLAQAARLGRGLIVVRSEGAIRAPVEPELAGAGERRSVCALVGSCRERGPGDQAPGVLAPRKRWRAHPSAGRASPRAGLPAKKPASRRYRLGDMPVCFLKVCAK